jgi:hypothetical protein
MGDGVAPTALRQLGLDMGLSPLIVAFQLPEDGPILKPPTIEPEFNPFLLW